MMAHIPLALLAVVHCHGTIYRGKHPNGNGNPSKYDPNVIRLLLLLTGMHAVVLRQDV